MRSTLSIQYRTLRALTCGARAKPCGHALIYCAARGPRYDFFYKNGVPKWRGTGYYYSRFRPGLGVSGGLVRGARECIDGRDADMIVAIAVKTVLVFLVLVTSGVQYLVQKMNYSRDLKRIETIIEQARSAAWGSKQTPVEGQRKVST